MVTWSNWTCGFLKGRDKTPRWIEHYACRAEKNNPYLILHFKAQNFFLQFAEVQTHILSLMFPLQLTDTHKTPICL